MNNIRRISTLIADAGSTKISWAFIAPDGTTRYFRTRGLNPAISDDRTIRNLLLQELLPEWNALQQEETHTEIHYYGAGCLPAVCRRMEDILTGTIPDSSATADSDLSGAARALCRHEAGIACILGTGSNSCLYDGDTIVQHVSPLGYILGDEGSGTALGKRLLGDLLKGLLPAELSRKFTERYGLEEADIIRKTYREPEANRFLASFCPFLKENRSYPEVHRIISTCFRSFFERNIENYRSPQLPVHFAGSIALHFKEELEATAREYGYHIGKILSEPIKDLVAYHMETKTIRKIK